MGGKSRKKGMVSHNLIMQIIQGEPENIVKKMARADLKDAEEGEPGKKTQKGALNVFGDSEEDRSQA